MEKNETQDVDLENNETKDDAPEDSNPEERTPELSDREKELEAEAAKWRRIAQQKSKKLQEEDRAQKKQGDWDYGQLAYLAAKGIDHEDEIDLARKVISETGKELKDILVSKYFRSELEEMREARKAKEAMPKTKTRGQTEGDDVGYYLAKVEAGETQINDVPPQFRYKVVEERIRKESGDSFIARRIAEKAK
jgi:hypothetical protein